MAGNVFSMSCALTDRYCHPISIIDAKIMSSNECPIIGLSYDHILDITGCHSNSITCQKHP